MNLNDKRVKPSHAAPSPAVSKPSDADPLPSGKEENKVQNTIGYPDNKSGPTPTSLAGIATAQAQVLLNVVPITITADNDNAVSTYAFLDNGCTDTHIDHELAEYLGLQGSPEQIRISTITDSENLVESNRVSFTLSSADGSGEAIHVTDAYILPDLNQSQRIIPEEIDVLRYSHLHDIDFPAVDIRGVSILVGSNISYAHIEKEVRVPEDRKRGLYGCRYALGWCVSGPYDVKHRQGIAAYFVSLSQMPDDSIQRFWNLEHYGAVNSGEKPFSVEDKRAPCRWTL